MARRHWMVLSGLILGTAIGTPASAQTIATQYEAGTQFTTGGLTGFQTSGADMNGMKVTATFSGGQSFTGFFSNLGTQTYGTVSYAAHGVSQLWGSITFPTNGDSNSNYWVLRIASGDYGALESLRFNGAPGRTIFDCRYTNADCAQTGGTTIEGTPGSSGAIAAQVAAANQFPDIGAHNLFAGSNVRGVYSNQIALTGSAPVGDLYEQFTLEFLEGGMRNTDGLFLFAVDTDNAQQNTTIVPVNTVPEPSAFGLVMAGLVALSVSARRRARA